LESEIDLIYQELVELGNFDQLVPSGKLDYKSQLQNVGNLRSIMEQIVGSTKFRNLETGEVIETKSEDDISSNLNSILSQKIAELDP
jgi:hypothetical protein